MPKLGPGDQTVIDLSGLDALIAALRARGMRTIGPTVRDGAILLDEIDGVGDLPAGWTDEQAPGRYRLKRRDDEAVFGYAVGPWSAKNWFHGAEERLFTARRTDDGGFELDPPPPPPAPIALIGARSCELAAIAVQDRVLGEGEHADPRYRERRAGAFVVVAQCGAPAATCFCVSMETGPAARAGFDLALTELLSPHRFVVEVGSDAGAEVLAGIAHTAAAGADRDAAAEVVADAARRMGRVLDTEDIAARLAARLEHPRWEEAAQRCLACTNCTMACPTCFCGRVEDGADLSGQTAWRTRRWDSCFTLGFSYIHGGSLRSSVAARYRQWLTHKLSSWHEQFGSSGCVGCGRCITWCPAGIDITEEAAAVLAGPPSAPAPAGSLEV